MSPVVPPDLLALASVVDPTLAPASHRSASKENGPVSSRAQGSRCLEPVLKAQLTRCSDRPVTEDSSLALVFGTSIEAPPTAAAEWRGRSKPHEHEDVLGTVTI